jgi:hypothetical protein
MADDKRTFPVLEKLDIGTDDARKSDAHALEKIFEKILPRGKAENFRETITGISADRPDYSMLRVDKVGVWQDSEFSKLDNQQQALVDRHIQKLLHAARDSMGFDPEDPKLSLDQRAMSGVGKQMGIIFQEAKRQCLMPDAEVAKYITSYTNNARESFANNPELIEGLKRNEDVARAQEAARSGGRQ